MRTWQKRSYVDWSMFCGIEDIEEELFWGNLCGSQARNGFLFPSRQSLRSDVCSLSMQVKNMFWMRIIIGIRYAEIRLNDPFSNKVVQMLTTCAWLLSITSKWLMLFFRMVSRAATAMASPIDMNAVFTHDIAPALRSLKLLYFSSMRRISPSVTMPKIRSCSFSAAAVPRRFRVISTITLWRPGYRALPVTLVFFQPWSGNPRVKFSRAPPEVGKRAKSSLEPDPFRGTPCQMRRYHHFAAVHCCWWGPGCSGQASCSRELLILVISQWRRRVWLGISCGCADPAGYQNSLITEQCFDFGAVAAFADQHNNIFSMYHYRGRRGWRRRRDA